MYTNTRYKELFIKKQSLDADNHLDLLIDLYSKNCENSFFFSQIRRTIRSIRRSSNHNPIKNEILESFGFNKEPSNEKTGRIAFVDHSFHCKTASSMFFVRALEKYYDVDIFWSSCWKGVPNDFLKNLSFNYKTAIYWQIFPNLNYEHPENTIIIPMWDGVINESDSFFRKYKDFTAISFCEALHKKLQDNGVYSRYIQYLPKTIKQEKITATNHENPSLYFWQRNYDMTWPILKKMIDPEKINSIIICSATDPGYDFIAPNDADIKKYNISIIDWMSSKETVRELLKTSDIYVAPRNVEGIGFSFIDAMEAGCTIICNDCGTMNEYINCETGYIVNYKNPMNIDFTDWKDKRTNMLHALEKKELENKIFENKLFEIMMERSCV